MDELKKIIDLNPLSDGEIKDRNISLSDLWMIKDDADQIYGPYDTETLRVYTGNHHHLFENSKIYNLLEEKWAETFSVSYFQRRKPALVSSQNLIATNEFYILLNGQQNGPYIKEEVQAFLNNGQIKSTTQISLDKGESWIKLYEHHVFDRRSKKSNQELPFMPAQDILEKMAITKEEILKAKEQEEAIVELAFLGHKKPTAKSTSKRKYKSENDEEIETQEPSDSHKKRFMLPMIALASLCVIVFASFQLYNKLQDTRLDRKEAKTDVKSINNSARQVKRKPASATQPKKAIKPKRVTKRMQKRVSPKRYKAKPRKRVVHKPRRKEVINQEIEKLDINDPEVQEEITRQLSGEYDLDGEEDSENEEDRDDFLDQRSDGYEGDEEREDHSSEDF